MCADGLAAVELAAGDFRRAITYAEMGLAGWTARGRALGRAGSLHLIGRGLLGAAGGKDPALLDRAMARLEEALQVREAFHHRRGQAEALLDMARVERDRGRLEEALARAQAALELTEKMRAEVTDPNLRASFVAALRDTYEVYIELLMLLHGREPTAGHDSAALQASERAHARVLLDALVEARADIRQGIDPELLARERQAQKRLGTASARLTDALVGKDGDASRARGEFEGAAAALRDVQAQIRRLSPAYAALMQPEPASVDEIRRHVLDDDTVLIEFHLGERRSFAWALTRSTLAGASLPARTIIEAAAIPCSRRRIRVFGARRAPPPRRCRNRYGARWAAWAGSASRGFPSRAARPTRSQSWRAERRSWRRWTSRPRVTSWPAALWPAVAWCISPPTDSWIASIPTSRASCCRW